MTNKPPGALFIVAAIMFLVGCSKEAAGPEIIVIESPTGPRSAQPHLSTTGDGSTVLSWLDHEDDGVVLRYATLTGDTWLPATDIARGNDWFVNWADFPSVVHVREQFWAAHWLQKRPGGTYSYDVSIALSTDGGQTWGDAITPHTDGTPTEHGFVSLYRAGNGVGAIWLDGRHMNPDAGHAAGDHGGGPMTLRSTNCRFVCLLRMAGYEIVERKTIEKRALVKWLQCVRRI